MPPPPPFPFLFSLPPPMSFSERPNPPTESHLEEPKVDLREPVGIYHDDREYRINKCAIDLYLVNPFCSSSSCRGSLSERGKKVSRDGIPKINPSLFSRFLYGNIVR